MLGGGGGGRERKGEERRWWVGGNTHAHTTSGLAWLGGEREREREPVREQNGWRRMGERRDLHTATIGEQPLTELRSSHGSFLGPAFSVFFSVVAERERERERERVGVLRPVNKYSYITERERDGKRQEKREEKKRDDKKTS